MDYKCDFLNSINGIELDVDVDNLLSVKHTFRICNNPQIISDFYCPVTTPMIGRSQLENSQRLKAYFISQFTVQEDDFEYEKYTLLLLHISAQFSHALWLIKDNAVRFNLGHLKYRGIGMIAVHSNFINSLYTNHHGEKPITKFSKEEIEKSKKYFDILVKNNILKVENEPEYNTYAGSNRIRRAFYFIDIARRSFDIGTKVSLYCSAFECLFSVASSELRHRLSETIANFLEDEFDSKKSIYQKMKLIYDLRSSVTHGSGINGKLLKNDSLRLKAIGENCDNILRRSILKIISDEKLLNLYLENNNEKIKEYMININFK